MKIYHPEGLCSCSLLTRGSLPLKEYQPEGLCPCSLSARKLPVWPSISSIIRNFVQQYFHWSLCLLIWQSTLLRRNAALGGRSDWNCRLWSPVPPERTTSQPRVPAALSFAYRNTKRLTVFQACSAVFRAIITESECLYSHFRLCTNGGSCNTLVSYFNTWDTLP